MRLRCGSLSITTPVSHLANEFDVRIVLQGQVDLAAVNQICVIHEVMNGCKNLKKDSLKDCFEIVNIGQCIRLRYSKTCLNRPLSKSPKFGFQDQLSLNAGQKYCRMLRGEHFAILSSFSKLPFVIKIYVFVYFEWSFKTGFTVLITLVSSDGSG